MELRHYQSAAIDGIFKWFEDGKEKCLIVLPTGTGKSLVQAAFIQRVLEEHDYVRIICATHSKELVRQNYDEIMGIWPACPSGIYSAGLKRRDNSQVLFAGIQSIYKRAGELGHTDILIVDECHTMHHKSEGRWYKFFNEMKAINPNIQIIGLTATPYRLDTGRLVPKTFHGIAYEYPVIDAVKEGYLSEVVSAKTETVLNTDGVGKRGGDFIPGELERAVDKPDVTKAAVKEIIKFGQDRKSWLIFSSGNKHAKHITDEICSYGVDAFCLTQETPAGERDEVIKAHKDGELKCIVNNMILTTGYNNRQLDLIACLRPTQSMGLWVQMVGRGMRLYPGKQNCLLLDFGTNLDRHGPIDKIRGNEERKPGNGEAPMKQCPSCFEPVHAACLECPECGFVFEMDDAPNIQKKASIAAVFSTQEIMKEIKKQEQKQATSLESLIRLGRSRGYKYPEQWARYVMASRKKYN